MRQSDVLLLGGGGFLGTALANFLSQEGRRVHLVGPSHSSSKPPNIIIHQGKLDDTQLLNDILPLCDTVFHMASASRPSDSAEHPTIEGVLNILPTLKFLEVMQSHKNIQTIYISSGGALYGEPLFDPIRERHPFSPRSYYGAGKASIEAFLSVFAKKPGQHVVILRPSNLYGPGQPLRKDFGFIRTLLDHILDGSVMEIWGDGKVKRDFLFIDDMVRLCSQLAIKHIGTDIYNVGYGASYSLNQVIDIAQSVIGRKIRVAYRSERNIDVHNVSLDCSRIQKNLGWKPEVTLEQGIRRTWAWIENL
jgi:UDP-glucose 4-epimerase